MNNLRSLLGQRVRITNHEHGRHYDGQLISFRDEPTLTIRRDDGTDVTVVEHTVKVDPLPDVDPAEVEHLAKLLRGVADQDLFLNDGEARLARRLLEAGYTRATQQEGRSAEETHDHT